MNFTTLIGLIKKIVDICFVWIVIYYVLKNIRKNVKFSMIFKGIIVVILIKIISDYFGFVTVGLLLEYVITWGPLALIIIFQPEIRNN